MLMLLVAFIGYFILYQMIGRPLTDGEVVRLVKSKTALLKNVESPRLIIIAGSNGRFSHSCEVIAPIIKMGCVNASLMAGVGLDYIYRIYLPLLRSGDIVYMPLEYEQYVQSKDEVLSGPENAILWRTDRALLVDLGWERVLHAAFYADENYFIRGIVEMLLNVKGVKRRFDESSINSHGDQTGHTKELGVSYSKFLSSKYVYIPAIRPTSAPCYSAKLISDFLRRAKSMGVTVIGGLPTTFADVSIPNGTRQELKMFYTNNGQSYLELPNYSQYSRESFFDMPYHLNEENQSIHSRKIGEAIKFFLTKH
jgi:hypothetical protein